MRQTIPHLQIPLVGFISDRFLKTKFNEVFCDLLATVRNEQLPHIHTHGHRPRVPTKQRTDGHKQAPHMARLTIKAPKWRRLANGTLASRAETAPPPAKLVASDHESDVSPIDAVADDNTRDEDWRGGASGGASHRGRPHYYHLDR